MSKKSSILLYLILIVGVFILYKFIISERFNILRNGEKVKVLVTKFPDCDYHGRHDSEFLRFTFEGNKCSKRLKLKYCKILHEKYFRKGIRQIEILTDEEHKSFVLPFEDLKYNYYAFILIEIIFSICLLKAILKKQSNDIEEDSSQILEQSDE
ncbi:hypothetical protein [Winogradskyella jejuensis]|uniref:DUF3592 domain-containing protein n=1 Tax=Winogradskyella jejuensis TaxID=1089305 RepID=A0A1M5P7Z9_9FLAO|nr:hypothetical protein [Winogradskyella jejuensis]SHG97926.1 hypothetical protein SAMN05444148_1407 [Winogradskyella jejuensis]